MEKPEPVTGRYKGQTITMDYAVITDYRWPSDNLTPGYFCNGRVPFYYYGTVREEENLDYVGEEKGGTYLDTAGRMVCKPIYYVTNDFNDNGIALVTKSGFDAEWVRLDKNGVECGPASDEEIRWQPDIPKAGVGFDKNVTVEIEKTDELMKPVTLKDESGHMMAGFDCMGTFYKGLAPFLQDGKLGFVGADGSIVIPASYPVRINYNLFVFNEDLLVVNVGWHIGIIRITRS